MDLLDITEMSLKRTSKVSAAEMKLGNMPPDTPSLALPYSGLTFHITHDFCDYDLMPLLKNFCTCH